MGSKELPEELITLIEVFAENDSLRAWFAQLRGASAAARGTELHRMATRMEAGGEDAGLVKAVRLLSHTGVFEGARAALEVARRNR